MRSPVETMSLTSAAGLAIHRTVKAAFVWQSSLRKGGSQMMRSTLPLRLAVARLRVSLAYYLLFLSLFCLWLGRGGYGREP